MVHGKIRRSKRKQFGVSSEQTKIEQINLFNNENVLKKANSVKNKVLNKLSGVKTKIQAVTKAECTKLSKKIGNVDFSRRASRFDGDAEVVEKYWGEYYSKVGRQGDDISNLIKSAQKRTYGNKNLVVENLGYSSYKNERISIGPDTKRWEFIEEFLHYKVDNNQAFRKARKAIKKEIKRKGYGNYGRVSEEIAVKQWMLNKSKLLKLDDVTQELLKKSG